MKIHVFFTSFPRFYDTGFFNMQFTVKQFYQQRVAVPEPLSGILTGSNGTTTPERDKRSRFSKRATVVT